MEKIIADVSGKGIPAALFMMTSKAIIQNCAKLGIGAAQILAKTNSTLCSGNDADMFVTAWVGILEIKTGIMICANAGHEFPAVCCDGKFGLLKDKHGFVLGYMDDEEYEEYEIQLKPGDKIFVYTDGVPEAANKDRIRFGTDKMIESLNSNAGASPRDLLKIVRTSIDGFVGGAEQFDGITMLCLEYHG